MRNIIIVAALLAAASTAGWFSIQKDGDHMTIDIDRAEIRGDTRQILDRGREILDRQQQQNSSSNSQSQAAPWQQTQPTAWGGGNQPVNQPLQERGFNAPPPPPYGSSYGQGQNYSPNQQPPNPPTNYTRQPAPYGQPPNYSR